MPHPAANESRPVEPMMQVPTAEAVEQAVRHCRAVFQTTLAAWVSDLLWLRRAGLHEPRWSGHDGTFDLAA